MKSAEKILAIAIVIRNPIIQSLHPLKPFLLESRESQNLTFKPTQIDYTSKIMNIEDENTALSANIGLNNSSPSNKIKFLNLKKSRRKFSKILKHTNRSQQHRKY